MTPSKVRARGNGIGTPDRGPELVEKQLLLSSPSIAATPLMHGSSGGRGGRWKWVLLVFLAAGSLVLWARSQGSASLGWEQSFVKVAGTQVRAVDRAMSQHSPCVNPWHNASQAEALGKGHNPSLEVTISIFTYCADTHRLVQLPGKRQSLPYDPATRQP